MSLLPGQITELYALAETISAGDDFNTACAGLAERLARVFASPIAIVRLNGGRWHVVAVRGQTSTPRLFANALRRGRAPTIGSSAAITMAGTPWTSVTLWDLGADRLTLLIAGDWTSSREVLDDTGRRAGDALMLSDARRHSTATRRLRAAATLSRRLVRASAADVPGIIADAAARAVAADRASIALYDREQRVLTVRATYGYPAALVKRLRLRPGTGIIGSVYQTGRAVIANAEGDALGKRRTRYRTGALMAVPLIGKDGVLGALSVCDPAGRAAFDRCDLRTLRALSRIACLALGRVEAAKEAEVHSRLAATDVLTSLFNRRYFLSRLDEEVERSRRQLSPLALLMLDVDGLKQINDRLGHPAGDQVLRAVAEVLHRSVRLFDVCTRYAGDEFAIVMPGADADSSKQVAERIRKDVEELRSATSLAPDLHVTVSIGIATFAATTAEDLFSRADQALYMAKRQGKNCIAIN